MKALLKNQLIIGESICLSATQTQLKVSHLKPSQLWISKDKREKITILKKWDKYFVVKNKYGDQSKILPEELLAKLTEGEYKLSSSGDIKKAIEQVGLILLPFFMGNKFLLGMIIRGILKMLSK